MCILYVDPEADPIGLIDYYPKALLPVPTPMGEFDWAEEPPYAEMFLTRRFALGIVPAHWSDVATFPVSSAGLAALDDLINTLQTMRQEMHLRLAPGTFFDYNVNNVHITGPKP
jgi:hypothetical protein